MTWTIIIPLIAQYGLPVAEKLFQKWAAGTPVTQADFDELRALGSQTARDRARAVLAAKGIPLDDPRALELLQLVG